MPGRRRKPKDNTIAESPASQEEKSIQAPVAAQPARKPDSNRVAKPASKAPRGKSASTPKSEVAPKQDKAPVAVAGPKKDKAPKAEASSEIVTKQRAITQEPSATKPQTSPMKKGDKKAPDGRKPHVEAKSQANAKTETQRSSVAEPQTVVGWTAIVGVPQAEVILNVPLETGKEIPLKSKRSSRRGGRGGVRQRQRKAEALAREQAEDLSRNENSAEEITPRLSEKRAEASEIKEIQPREPQEGESSQPEEQKKSNSRNRRSSSQRRRKQAEKRAATEAAAAAQVKEEIAAEPELEPEEPEEEDIDLKAPRKRGARLRLEAPKEYAVKNKMRERLYSKLEIEDENITKIYRSVEKFLISKIQINSEHKLLCAVSGGVDSVVLLDVLAQLKSKIEFSLVVCHFNHKLRGADADADEAFVRKLAADYNLQFISGAGNVAGYAKKNSLSVESAARALRYNFFERTSRSIKADFVVMAHTYDDAAETFMINLIRGSGLAGLSGITPVRRFVKNIMIVRPLIDTTKSNIIEYADRRDLNWREDLTNTLVKYTRNKVRHELLPFMKERFSPAIVELINRAAGLISGANEFVKNYVQERLDECVIDVKPESFSISIGSLMAYGKFIRGEIIQYALRKYFRSLSLPLKSIDAILNLMNSDTGAIADVSKNFMVARDREALIFMRKSKRVEIDRMILSEGEYKIGGIRLSLKKVTKKEAKFSEDTNIEFLDYDLVPKILYVRNWREGDTFNPLGMEGAMKISDFLINTKTPITEKPYVYLMSSRTQVIWVIGKRISNAFRVTNRTKNFLRAEVTILNDKKN
ncbi:MAG: tRNA lysidine(34) synthetase TilS [Chloroflexota bacterium]